MEPLSLTRLAMDFAQPLIVAGRGAAAEARWWRELGIVLPAGASLLGGTRQAVDALAQAAWELAREDEQASAERWLALLGRVGDGLRQLRQGLDAIGGAGSGLPADLPARLADHLMACFLGRRAPVVRQLLVMTRVLEETWVEAPAGVTNRIGHWRREFHWDRLPGLITDPGAALRSRYGWDRATGIELARMLQDLRDLGEALGLRAEYQSVDRRARAGFASLAGLTASVPTDPETRVVVIPLLTEEVSPVVAEIHPLYQAGPTPVAEGLGISLLLDPAASLAFDLSDHLRAELALDLSVEGLGVIVLRGRDPRLISDLLGASPEAVAEGAAFEARLTLTHERDDGRPSVVLGLASGTRLEIGSIAVTAALAKAAGEAVEWTGEMRLAGGALAIDLGEGDGFVGTLTGSGLRVPFEVALAISSRRGVSVVGGAGWEAHLPMRVTVGNVIQVESLDLAIRARAGAGGPTVELLAGVGVAVGLGPLQVNLERVGLVASVGFPGRGGNLGMAQVRVGFKSPDGAGLAVKSEAVTGGGYLFFNSDQEEYAGAVQLRIQEFLDLKAVGLLTTRLPDLAPGTRGFSLLVLIAAEFAPIQLGFGFTLSGVGGLLGVHRTMRLEALREGIKARTLDSVLFPEDPVARAPQILRDLRSVFPPATGRFVLGPMARLGWGTPTLITLELGLVIELPMPIRIALLGTLSMALPRPEAALVVLHMDVLGTLDVARREASLDATLYDSRILTFALSGDMAMRLNWGESPEFILSVGGFNPRYAPPPGFPALERMTLALTEGDNPRLRLESYLAVTSNTFQLGARLDVHASADVALIGRFSASATLGFDTLLQFEPFHFIADVYAKADLRWNGNPVASADLWLTLDGPGPFRVTGFLLVNFLGRHRVSVDVTLGEPAPPEPLPVSRPRPLLEEALVDRRNWAPVPPAGAALPVIVRERGPEEPWILPAFGGLRVRQTILPLNTVIERLGTTVPDEPGPFFIDRVSLKGTALRVDTPRAPVRENFAPAQYFVLSDDEKLSRPSFELREAGIELAWDQFEAGAGRYAAGGGQGAAWEFDTVVVDDPGRSTDEFRSTIAVGAGEAVAWLAAGARSLARQEPGPGRFDGRRQAVRVEEPVYVILDSATGQRHARAGSFSGNYTDAVQWARATGDSGALVVGRHEIQD